MRYLSTFSSNMTTCDCGSVMTRILKILTYVTHSLVLRSLFLRMTWKPFCLGPRQLKAGDVCRVEAQVVAIMNSESGKAVRVSGHVLCEDNPITTRTPSTIGEPDYTVELITDADVGILLSKDWFEWADKSKPLTVGTRLIFPLHSEVRCPKAKGIPLSPISNVIAR